MPAILAPGESDWRVPGQRKGGGGGGGLVPQQLEVLSALERTRVP